MTNINLDLAVKLEGSETHMLAVLIDSYGDKLIIPMMADTKIEGADYFIPCATCGNAVLDCNFKSGSESCDHCNTKTKKETIMDLETQIKTATLKAEDLFWGFIATSFPTATTGDVEPLILAELETIMYKAVKNWVQHNVPEPTNESWTNSLYLNYPEIWHMHDTGGGCMVATTDNFLIGKNHNYLAVSDECVAIYTDTFKSTSWLMEPICVWYFGDNPTVLMNYIDEFFGGSSLWNTGKLFQDIMTISFTKL